MRSAVTGSEQIRLLPGQDAQTETQGVLQFPRVSAAADFILLRDAQRCLTFPIFNVVAQGTTCGWKWSYVDPVQLLLNTDPQLTSDLIQYQHALSGADRVISAKTHRRIYAVMEMIIQEMESSQTNCHAVVCGQRLCNTASEMAEEHKETPPPKDAASSALRRGCWQIQDCWICRIKTAQNFLQIRF